MMKPTLGLLVDLRNRCQKIGDSHFRLHPARGAIDLARGIEARRAETIGSARESPGRRRRTRPIDASIAGN